MTPTFLNRVFLEEDGNSSRANLSMTHLYTYFVPYPLLKMVNSAFSHLSPFHLSIDTIYNNFKDDNKRSLELTDMAKQEGKKPNHF